MVSNISSRCLYIWAQIWDCKYNFRSASRCFESAWKTTSRVVFIFEHKHPIVNTNFDLHWNCLKYSFSCFLHIWAGTQDWARLSNFASYTLYPRPFNLSNFSVTNKWLSRLNRKIYVWKSCVWIGLKTSTKRMDSHKAPIISSRTS